MSFSYCRFALKYWSNELLWILGLGVLYVALVIGLCHFVGNWAAQLLLFGSALAWIVALVLHLVPLFMHWRLIPGASRRLRAADDEAKQVPPELARAWSVMSELFLDTEHDASDIDRIADSLAGSPFGDHELTRMFREEVAPAVCFNSLDVAGVWEGFDDEWLIREVLCHRSLRWFRRFPLKQFRTWRSTWYVMPEWHRIMTQVRARRGGRS